MLRKAISPLVKDDSSVIRQNLVELRSLPDLPTQLPLHVKLDRNRIIENLTAPFVCNTQARPEIEVGKRCFRQDIHAKYVGFSYTSPGSTPLSSPLRIDTCHIEVEEETCPLGLGSSVFNEFSFSGASSVIRSVNN